MSRFVSWRRLGLALLGLAFAVGPASAQQLASMNDLQTGHSRSMLKMSRLMSGQEQPGAKDEEVFKDEARYYVLRLAAGQPQDVPRFQTEFMGFITRVKSPNNKNNQAFLNKFSAALMGAFKEVLDQDFNGRKHTVINVAALLPESAKLGTDPIGDYLAGLVKDKNKHDVVKLYAARGLREVLPARALTEEDDPPTTAQMKRKERDLKYVTALVEYVERKPPEKLSRVEADGVRFLRREAVESLAMARVPAIVAIKGKALEGPVAPTLLKVLAKQGLQPEPGLTERLEAAIGIAHTRYNVRNFRITEYDPEPGIYLVGQFLYDFATEYNKDLPNIKGQGKKAALLPWRIHARRLEAAVKDLTVNARGLKGVEDKARKFEERALPILKAMSDGQLRQAERLNEFRNFVNSELRPKNAKVSPFKTHTGTEIELP